jgi:hypothetical protein
MHIIETFLQLTDNEGQRFEGSNLRCRKIPGGTLKTNFSKSNPSFELLRSNYCKLEMVLTASHLIASERGNPKGENKADCIARSALHFGADLRPEHSEVGLEIAIS